MKIVSFYNMKGGVGKTTLSVNYAYLASTEGIKTLFVDLDPQGAASYYFRVRPSKKFNSGKLLKGGKKLSNAIKASDFENLDMIPASISFRKLDIKMNSSSGKTNQLKKLLKQFSDEYDLVVIDSPPNISIISENILFASDLVIIPVIPTPLCYEAYKKILTFFSKDEKVIKKLYGLFSMVEKRKKIHLDIMRSIEEEKYDFLKNVVPYKSDFERMGVKREPLPHNSKSSAAGKILIQVYKEITGILMNKSKTPGR